MYKFKDYFYGNKISDYGLKHGYVDYRTLAKAFDSVLNNNLIYINVGYWEKESGSVDNSDYFEELEEKQEYLEDLKTKLEEAQEKADYMLNTRLVEMLEAGIDRLDNAIMEIDCDIAELQREMEEEPEIFQWYVVDDQGADILKEFNEVVYYNEELDIYLWGITHYGTSWDYVLTNIPCAKVC